MTAGVSIVGVGEILRPLLCPGIMILLICCVYQKKMGVGLKGCQMLTVRQATVTPTSFLYSELISDYTYTAAALNKLTSVISYTVGRLDIIDNLMCYTPKLLSETTHNTHNTAQHTHHIHEHKHKHKHKHKHNTISCPLLRLWWLLLCCCCCCSCCCCLCFVWLVVW